MFKLVHDTNISWYSFGYAVNVVFSNQALIYKHAKKFCEFYSFKRRIIKHNIFVDVMWGVPNIMKFVLLAFIDSLLALN